MDGINYVDILIPFVGGLGLFIYGMQIMAQGLQKAAGTKMKKLLEVLTNNKFLGVLLGAFITAIIQSSSATTVMVVGFVNAGIMNLSQAMGVIMGANIGTTATGWIVSSAEWAKFLNPTVIAPVLVMVGVIMYIASKKAKVREIGSIIIGFGILFLGIEMMSDAVYPLRSSESFKQMFVTLGANPILGVLAGAGVTAIIQSSSASVGILQTLAASGLVPFNAAIYIIMGQNIGTCITAMLSSIGASKNAKSAAYMHLLFNIIGSIIFSIVAVLYFTFANSAIGALPISQTQISIVHTAFNIANTIILFPFSAIIIKMAKALTNFDESTTVDVGELIHLDDRVLETPSFAVQSAVLEVVRMGHIVIESFDMASEAVLEKNKEKVDIVFEREKSIDNLNDAITSYLVKICNTNINDHENEVVTSLLHVVGDIERVGDHCENLVELVDLMLEENTTFSETAVEELAEIIKISKESFEDAIKALEKSDITFAYETVRKEDIVDDLEKELRLRHIHRLASNQCVAAAGVVFLDALTNLERISDHALNIAEVVINEKRSSKVNIVNAVDNV